MKDLDTPTELHSSDQFDSVEYNAARLKLAEQKRIALAVNGTGSALGGYIDSNGTDSGGIYAASGMDDYDVGPVIRSNERHAFMNFLYNTGSKIASYFLGGQPSYVHPNENDLLGARNIWAQFLSEHQRAQLASAGNNDPSMLDNLKATVSKAIIGAATSVGTIIADDGKVLDAEGEQIIGPNDVPLEAAHVDAAETEMKMCSSAVLPDEYYEAKQLQFERLSTTIKDTPDLVDLEELPEELRLKFESVLSDGQSLADLDEAIRTEIMTEYDNIYVTGQRVENQLQKIGIENFKQLEELTDEAPDLTSEGPAGLTPPFSTAGLGEAAEEVATDAAPDTPSIIPPAPKVLDIPTNS